MDNESVEIPENLKALVQAAIARTDLPWDLAVWEPKARFFVSVDTSVL